MRIGIVILPQPRWAEASTLWRRAQGIGGTAEATGDGVREIHGDEGAVDVVHHAQQELGAGQIVLAQAVQHLPPQFRGSFSHRVEVGRIFHSQVRRRNSSRPTSWRLVPSLRSSFSTCDWVAIPA